MNYWIQLYVLFYALYLGHPSLSFSIIEKTWAFYLDLKKVGWGGTEERGTMTEVIYCALHQMLLQHMLAHRYWCTIVCERWLVWVLARVPLILEVSCGFTHFLQGNTFLPNRFRFLTHHNFVLYSLDFIWKAGQYLDNYAQCNSLEISYGEMYWTAWRTFNLQAWYCWHLDPNGYYMYHQFQP
jgi:hypothetical protein